MEEDDYFASLSNFFSLQSNAMIVHLSRKREYVTFLGILFLFNAINRKEMDYIGHQTATPLV